MSKKSVLLMGDLNFPGIDWENNCTDKLGEGFLDVVQNKFWT